MASTRNQHNKQFTLLRIVSSTFSTKSLNPLASTQNQHNKQLPDSSSNAMNHTKPHRRVAMKRHTHRVHLPPAFLVLAVLAPPWVCGLQRLATKSAQRQVSRLRGLQVRHTLIWSWARAAQGTREPTRSCRRRAASNAPDRRQGPTVHSLQWPAALCRLPAAIETGGPSLHHQRPRTTTTTKPTAQENTQNAA